MEHMLGVQNYLKIIWAVNQVNCLLLRQYFLVQTLSHHLSCLAEIDERPGCLNLLVNSGPKWQKGPWRQRNCTVITGDAGRQAERAAAAERKESFFKNIKRYWFYNYFSVIPTPLYIWNFHSGDKRGKPLNLYREISVQKWEIKVYIYHMCKLVVCKKQRNLVAFFRQISLDLKMPMSGSKTLEVFECLVCSGFYLAWA